MRPIEKELNRREPEKAVISELERSVDRLDKVIEKIDKVSSIISQIELPTEVSISNFPTPEPCLEFPDFPDFPTEMKVEVKNFPPQVFPKVQKVEVLNQVQIPEAKEIEFPKVQKVEVLNFPSPEKISFPEPKDVVFPDVQKSVLVDSDGKQIDFEKISEKLSKSLSSAPQFVGAGGGVSTGMAKEETLSAINNKLVNGNDIGDVTLNNPFLPPFNPANQSSFGTLEVGELTPVFQGDFVYGLNTQVWSPAVVSGTGATVDTNASRLRIQSGTANNGYAYISPRRPVRYRAGQGTVARFTPIFTAGVANNIQLWGMGNLASNVPYDGYFFGYNGISFGIVHYVRGVASWTLQASWNGTALTIDPTKGTPMMIKYPYLGFGDIMFFIQNPTTGLWVLVHTIRYANTVSTTQLSNPTLHFLGFTLNSGNTTNQIMYCGSVGVFVSGIMSFIGNPKWAMDSVKTGVTTETNLLTLKNSTTYNGLPNTGLIRVTSMSISSSAANGNSVFRIKTGVTVGGTPSFTTINGTSVDAGVTITSGNSIASYDVAGTTVANGTYITGFTADNPNSSFLDLLPYEIFLAPGETLTVSGYSSISAGMGVAINWSEDV